MLLATKTSQLGPENPFEQSCLKYDKVFMSLEEIRHTIENKVKQYLLELFGINILYFLCGSIKQINSTILTWAGTGSPEILCWIQCRFAADSGPVGERKRIRLTLSLQQFQWNYLDLCYLKNWGNTKQLTAAPGCQGMGLGSWIQVLDPGPTFCPLPIHGTPPRHDSHRLPCWPGKSMVTKPGAYNSVGRLVHMWMCPCSSLPSSNGGANMPYK